MYVYAIILALHLVAVISWMAAMLYLPRLYVYHADATKGGEADATFKTMERRLLRYIATPAMIATFTLGAGMIFMRPDLLSAPWLHAKIALVVAMAGAHGLLAAHRKKFERAEGFRSARYYRIVNEVPTVLMIIIIFLAILKPGMDG
ncbi:MAG: protoporphyrinogen oxidase HemJ [Rickettsiales bacterium]